METRNKFIKTLPNVITTLRIIGAIFLILVSYGSIKFFIIYTLVGLTDALDGYFARKFNVQSRVGATLDSIADLIFYFVILIKLMPTLLAVLPNLVWYGVAIVVILRIFCYIFVAIKFHKFASIHTYLNKLSSLVIFLLPYFVISSFLRNYAFVVVSITLLAVTEEIIIHTTAKTYATKKSLFFE